MEGQMFTFGHIEMRKVMKGALIAIAGSLLAYIMTNVIPLFNGTSYAVLIPAMSVIVNIAYQFVKNNTQG